MSTNELALRSTIANHLRNLRLTFVAMIFGANFPSMYRFAAGGMPDGVLSTRLFEPRDVTNLFMLVVIFVCGSALRRSYVSRQLREIRRGSWVPNVLSRVAMPRGTFDGKADPLSKSGQLFALRCTSLYIKVLMYFVLISYGSVSLTTTPIASLVFFMIDLVYLCYLLFDTPTERRTIGWIRANLPEEDSSKIGG